MEQVSNMTDSEGIMRGRIQHIVGGQEPDNRENEKGGGMLCRYSLNRDRVLFCSSVPFPIPLEL